MCRFYNALYYINNFGTEIRVTITLMPRIPVLQFNFRRLLRSIVLYRLFVLFMLTFCCALVLLPCHNFKRLLTLTSAMKQNPYVRSATITASNAHTSKHTLWKEGHPPSNQCWHPRVLRRQHRRLDFLIMQWQRQVLWVSFCPLDTSTLLHYGWRFPCSPLPDTRDPTSTFQFLRCSIRRIWA